jgi:threonine synthase
MRRSQKTLSTLEGIFASPEGAAPLAALNQFIQIKIIIPDDRIVLFNTASGVKYI